MRSLGRTSRGFFVLPTALLRNERTNELVGAGCSFVGFGDNDIAIDVAAEFALAEIKGESGALPCFQRQIGAVLVVMRGGEGADGEETAGVEDAVAMGGEEATVEVDGRPSWGEVDRAGGAVAIFSAEIGTVRLGLFDKSSRGAQADIQFFDGVVVDQVELDVFIAAGFASGGIGFIEEIEVGAAFGRLFGHGFGLGIEEGRRQRQEQDLL